MSSRLPLVILGLLACPFGFVEAQDIDDHAREALGDLDRFGPPASVTPQDWPELKRKLAATANFALGRASLAKALELPAGQARTLLIGDCESSLLKAQVGVEKGLLGSAVGAV